MRKLMTVVGCLLLLVAAPILIPAAMIDHALFLRRKRRDAERTPCGVCGIILGEGALDLAEAGPAAGEAAWEREGLRLRVVRTLHAICTACGSRYDYRDGAFHRLAGGESQDSPI